METRRVDIELKYDDEDITRDVAPYIKSIHYVDRTVHNKSDELSITFENVNKLWSNPWFPKRGSKLSAIIKVADWFTQGDSLERDCGVFEIDDVNDSWTSSEFKVSAVSVGISSSIRRQQNTNTWENVNIKEIAVEIATAHGFELMWFSNYNPVVERWEQKSKSDLSALIDICEYAGLMLKITGEHIVIFRGDEFDLEEAEKIIYSDKDGIKQADFNANSSDIYSACEVKYYDPNKKEMIEYIYTPDGISGLKGGVEDEGLEPIPDPEVGQVLKLNQRVSSIAEAQEVTRAALRVKNMRQVRGSITMIGRPDLYSGMNIKLDGFNRWDSVTWNIEEITHDYNSGSGYVSSLNIRGVLGY